MATFVADNDNTTPTMSLTWKAPNVVVAGAANP